MHSTFIRAPFKRRHIHRALICLIVSLLIFLRLERTPNFPSAPVASDASKFAQNSFQTPKRFRKINSLEFEFHRALNSGVGILEFDHERKTRHWTPSKDSLPRVKFGYDQKRATDVVDIESEFDLDSSENNSEDDSDDTANEPVVPDIDPLEVNTAESDNDDDSVNDQLSFSNKTMSTRRFPPVRFREDVGVLAEAAGMSRKLMVEMMRDRLVGSGVVSEADYEKLVAPKEPTRQIPKWHGNKEYLYKNGLPTCFGKSCSRNEYVNVQHNLTQLATSQFMSPYWMHMDLSKLTYASEDNLIDQCRKYLCKNQACASLSNVFETLPVSNTSSLVRMQRLVHLLNRYGSIESEWTHCIRAMAPIFDASNPSVLTNFTPVLDGVIGDKMKRARFVGDEICSLFNSSTSDVLKYIGAHQCPKARIMRAPLPLAKPIALLDESTEQMIKKRKGKKRPVKKEVQWVDQTLNIRYIKVDKFRYHSFHDPVIVSLRNAFVSHQGVVFTSEFYLHPESSCVSDPASAFTLPIHPPESVPSYQEIFVASANGPTDHSSANTAFLHLDVFPKLATHFPELSKNPSIRIHVNSRAGSPRHVAAFLSFLGMPDPASRIVTGIAHARIVHVPEPNVHCNTPHEYGLHKLRRLISEKLDEKIAFLPPTDILVVIPKNPAQGIKNAAEAARMLEKEFRGNRVRIIRVDRGSTAGFGEMVERFHAAKAVVSVDGAGLGYVFAMQFGGGVVEILEEPRGRIGWDLANSMVTRLLGVTWYGMVVPLVNGIDVGADGKSGRLVDLVKLHAVVNAILEDLK